MRRIGSLAVLSVLLPALSPAAMTATSDRVPLGQKTQTDAGALVMLPGFGQDWSLLGAYLRKSLSSKFIVETAESSDVKDIQAALDKLQARRVKKVVAVPMILSSHSAEMDENRYIFGIREQPSTPYIGGAHSHSGYSLVRRAKAKVPLVLTGALDDHPLFADLVADRARAQSKDESRESLVIVAPASGGDLANSQWAGTIQSLADKVRKATRFKSVAAVFLPEDASQEEREKAEQSLRSQVRSLAQESRAIVVPLSLARGPERQLRRVFDGIFVRFDGKAVLPDNKVLAWVEESLAKGMKLPDMRAFTKDMAMPAPPQAGKLSVPRFAPVKPGKAAQPPRAEATGTDSEAP